MTDDRNPYQPPASAVSLAPETVAGRPLAGKWRRLGTLLIDYLGWFVFAILIGAVLGLVSGLTGLELIPTDGAGSWLFGLAAILGYYLFFETLWARTPGKWILGTVVTDLDGRPPRFGAILKRTLARCVPFEPFTFFGETGFHDKASRTRVVRTR